MKGHVQEWVIWGFPDESVDICAQTSCPLQCRLSSLLPKPRVFGVPGAAGTPGLF